MIMPNTKGYKARSCNQKKRPSLDGVPLLGIRHVGRPRVHPAARFCKYFDMTDGCWLWKGAVAGNRYGQFTVVEPDRYRKVMASRYSYELFVADIPPGLMVCHTCDTPRCVNPDHLFLGTNADNMRDMVKKGRASWQKGKK